MNQVKWIALSSAVVLAGVGSAAFMVSGDDSPPSDTVRAAGSNEVYSSAAFPTLAKGAAAAELAAPTTDWAKIVNGALTYKRTDKGDRIMDFSTAGFAGGGVALPTNIPVRVTVNPSGGDDSQAIQTAINTVSAIDRGSDRYRGVVKLGAGTFKINKTLNINATGVLIVGSGSGAGGTVIELTGTTGFGAFQFGVSQAPTLSNTVNLTSSYIKSGSNSVQVSSTAGFAVGQRVQMLRKVTTEWIKYMGMDKLVRDGQPQTWLAAGSTIPTPRAITAINTATKVITFDSAVTDSLDSTYLGSPVGTLSRADYPGRLSWVGIEKLQIKAPAGATIYPAVTMANLINGYVSDVVGVNVQNAFKIEKDAQQITLDKVIVTSTISQSNPAPTGDFSINGSQILVNKSASRSKGNWALVTGSGVGPLVLLNFSTDTGTKGIGPHQRWYTGLLVDTATVPGTSSTTPGIAYTNRGTAGTGHGWTTGWSVAWNVTSPYFKVQAAPGTLNWCIGCIGSDATPSPKGVFDSQGTKVGPASLYLQQLYERGGISALNAIGYSSTTP